MNEVRRPQKVLELAALWVLGLVVVLGAGVALGAQLVVLVKFRHAATWPATDAVVLTPFLNAGEPMLGWPAELRAGPLGFWTAAGAVMALLAVPVGWLCRGALRVFFPDPRFAGFATSAQEKRTMGERSVRRESARVRPGIDVRRAPLAAVAAVLGRSARTGNWLCVSFQTALGTIGRPREGKGTALIGPISALYPGPQVVTMAGRPDLLALTGCLPDAPGRPHVFDPEGISGWPEEMRFDLLRGCDTVLATQKRARSLISATADQGENQAGANTRFFID